MAVLVSDAERNVVMAVIHVEVFGGRRFRSRSCLDAD